MARLYHYQGDPQQHFLLGSVNGSNTTIQCGPLADRIFQEMDHVPGIRGTRRGPQLPGELVHGMWETGLLFTGDEQHKTSQNKELTEGGESPELAAGDCAALRELLSEYSGPVRGKLEALADTLDISVESNESNQAGGGSGRSKRAEPASAGSSSVDDDVLRDRLKEAGVTDTLSADALKAWSRKSTNPSLDTLIDSLEMLRSVAFLRSQDFDPIISVYDAADPEEATEVTGVVSGPGMFNSEAEISLSRFHTSDGVLPAEENKTGSWENEFLTVWWYIYSTLQLDAKETAESISCETTVDLTSSGVTSVHTDAWEATGHRREEYAIRRHQTELTEQVLEHHIESPGPFCLPETVDFTQYPSTVDFYEESLAGRMFD